MSSPSILRLIFQGRFLHGNVTLGGKTPASTSMSFCSRTRERCSNGLSPSPALKLPPGRTTVMHLVARETLPEPNSHGEALYVRPRPTPPPAFI